MSKTKRKPNHPRKHSAKKPTAGKGKTLPAPKTPVRVESMQAAPAEPTHDTIAVKAHEIWVAKGRPIGQDDVNWEEAKQALAG